jgi:hypothetical protein
VGGRSRSGALQPLFSDIVNHTRWSDRAQERHLNAFAAKAEDGRPSNSSRGTNAFIVSMTVLPFQLGRAFATSRCSPNGTAKMIVSASSASRSDLATTVGPIARACGANASGGRRLATATLMFLRAKARARARPTAPNPTIA